MVALDVTESAVPFSRSLVLGESLDEAQFGLLIRSCCDCELPGDLWVDPEGETRHEAALWFDSQRLFSGGRLNEFGCFGDLLWLPTCRPSSGDLVLSRTALDESYGLKLDFGVSLELFDSVPGDSLSRLLFVLFSILASNFGLGESEPMALHVCANSAKGLVFESN